MHPLLERQKELEASGVSEGIRRFRRRLEEAERHGRGSQVGAARKLLQTGIEPLASSFQALVEESKGRRGPKHYVLKWIELIGTEELAYLTTKTVLDHASKPTTLRAIALDLSSCLVDEMRYRRLQDEAPGLFDYRMATFNTSNTAHMKRSLDATLHYAEVNTSDLDMTTQVRLVIGIKLVDMLVSATGLVELEHAVVRVGKKVTRETRVRPTAATLKWLDERNGALEALWPVSMPMVVPPLHWSPGKPGGYRFALFGRHRLVRGITKDMAERVKAREMPKVYEALNHIQETAWKINPAVYQLMQAVVNRGGDMGGIPKLEPDALPPKPHDIATNADARKVWRKAAHVVKERNHMRKLKALEFHKTFATAGALVNDPAVYFPCTLDFRGRVYPVTNYLNPQGDDISKGLLTFAEGKPLGERGGTALALHGANCLGETPQGLKLSKATLQERVDAMVALTPTIERIASDPILHREWCAATVDDPYQFYAFCVEWAAFIQLEREGRGSEFVSSLPCAMDGTCNGLQHFAALLCDPVGGEAVNVVPSERPQDIYQRIADAVLKRLEQDASTDAHAVRWLSSGLVNRKLAKRPTMTFGYGSKKFGFQQQLIDYVRTHEVWADLKPLFSEDGKRPGNLLSGDCGYMSALIWNALQDIVVAASQAMRWMQDAARLVASKKVCVEWNVPVTDFPVRQTYMEANSRRIETVLQGKLYKPRVYDVTNKPDLMKQSNAIAPNFVHSLDAACLMLTVNEAARRGLTHFGMVHDSYASHAADYATLADVTRETFVRLYTEQDVIGGLSLHLSGLVGHPDEFPLPPLKGKLDVTCVRQSFYFFS